MDTDAVVILRQVYGFLLMCFLLMLACVGSVVYANYKREQVLTRVLESIEKNCCDIELDQYDDDPGEDEDDDHIISDHSDDKDEL